MPSPLFSIFPAVPKHSAGSQRAEGTEGVPDTVDSLPRACLPSVTGSFGFFPLPSVLQVYMVGDQDGFGDGGPCSEVRILLIGGKEESPEREEEIRTWKKRVRAGEGRSNPGRGQGLNWGEGSYRCSTAAARTCRRGHRRPGRAPPLPRHSHRRHLQPQLGPGPPPQALPPVAIATSFVPASLARPTQHQAAGAEPGTGVIP